MLKIICTYISIYLRYKCVKISYNRTVFINVIVDLSIEVGTSDLFPVDMYT